MAISNQEPPTSFDEPSYEDVPTTISAEEEKVFVASYKQLMWWRFKKHRLAVVSLVVLIILYLIAVFVEFVAPYAPEQFFAQYKLAPPSEIHIVDNEGVWQRPFIYHFDRTRDPVTLASVFTVNEDIKYPIYLFVESAPYEMWGFIPMNIKLFGLDVPHEEQGVFLFGADRLGRDMLSRTIHGARISLSLGLVGVLFSLVLGILIGGVSGYYGGGLDNFIQRVIEFIRSIPDIPLWMGLSAALPADMPVTQRYFLITVILSLIGWTGLARVVRGRFLSMREEDFVMAARLMGTGEMRIIVRHMVPSFMSYLIAALTLSIPGMILAETGLSFLGLGLRAPAISWGVLLQEAQKLSMLVLAPWVFIPGIAVILTILAFNFLGDGLRDAADPYSR
jgi:peptide/nickel transport system permease protein